MRDLSLLKAEEENFCIHYDSRKDGSGEDEMLKYSSSSVSSTRKVYILVIRSFKTLPNVSLEKVTNRFHLR